MKSNKSSWGRNIVIVYTLFACATLAFVGFAMTQRVDLVSDHYYEDALNHDRTSAARQRARVSGARFVVDSSHIRVCLDDGSTVMRDMSVVLRRPDDPGLDRRYALTALDQSAQRVRLDDLRGGVWRIEATWRDDNEEFRLDTIIRVAP